MVIDPLHFIPERNVVVVEKYVPRREVLPDFRVNAANDAFAVGPAVGEEDHGREPLCSALKAAFSSASPG